MPDRASYRMMMNRRMLLAMTLVAVPTIAFCLLGGLLLRNEQQWLEGQAESAARNRVESAAGILRLAAAAIRTRLSDALASLPAEPLPELEALRSENPFVRMIFLWRPEAGLIHPPGDSLNPPERDFIATYAPLWAATGTWAHASAPADDPGAESPVARDLVNPRKGSRKTPARPSGWIPWFAGNAFAVIGWVQLPDGRVCGIELETVSLVSRLIPLFPSDAPPGTVLALLDGNGVVVARSGSDDDPAALKAVVSASLAPYLPHWEVVLFSSMTPGTRIGRSFGWLGGLLLAILASVILVGAGLFAREAGRHRLDAMRKTTFVSNVSHELKTPLTNIRLYAELLQEGRVPDPEKRRRYLSVIVDEAQRLTRLVSNILDFSRLEKGRKTYAVTPVDLAGWLRRFAETHGERARVAGLALTVEAPEAAGTMYDRDALDQVAMNLLDNAIKYAASGQSVEFRLERRGTRWQLRVSDRGPGIPARLRERVFEKFFRVDSSLTTARPGSGLGLAIARGMARDLGGDLKLVPRDGGGSVFVLEFPESGPEAAI